ncbi:MAG: carboxypeptidase Y-deficient [Peltula sp. TS41687]|nr:MAG: carboxypeptidase Y-deficient [Peltula sp. TS41687]
MSRKLGGGRILGSGGSSLSPATIVQQRRPSYLSPSSESSVSLNSQISTSQVSGGEEQQDLSSRVSLDNRDTAVLSERPTSTKLACPICNEDMLTLLQLNRHLDDNHQNLEAVEQDEVKTWFKKQMVKAKKFQPLAVLNQKLKGLDVFEPNEIQPSAAGVSTNGMSTPENSIPDPDEVVTRSHWQKSSSNDRCSEPMCGKRLGTTNGSINCRKCGRLFCEEHTMYQIKLSRSAQHEPVRGFWCRVCETCYKSREGYNDHNGFCRDHTDYFSSLRKKTVDKRYLEIVRLEKRLSKLTQGLARALAEQGSGGNAGLLWSLTGQRSQRKAIEQSVVAWEDDSSVAKCPFCQQEFSNYALRRHHCRLCGRVVCSDTRTACSTEIGLDVAAGTGSLSEKSTSQIRLDIRMCKDCKHTLFSRRDFAEELARKTPDVQSYETLVQFERGIRMMLPRFQRLLMALQDPDKPPTPSQLIEASRTRKRLLDSFTQYDVAARRIRDLPSASPGQKKLQKAIYHEATSFLHLHMLPLKALPKVLKHASPNGTSNHGGALASIKHGDKNSLETASQATSVSSSSAISALEAEEKSLRERLIVLEEQRFLVGEMVADASKRRRFEEVTSLTANVRDLEREIEQVNGLLGRLDLDFKGVYGQVDGLG